MLLLTNDDGVEAAGLRALADGLAADHAITVVAPRTEQSARSHALTMHRPLRVEPLRAGWHAVTGTPADSVYVALHHICKERPSVVVSGINRGANLGDDVHYSGTVAAAMEAAMIGVPALAVSLCIWPGGGPRAPSEPHWDTAVALARRIVAAMLADPLPPQVFLNLNVPDVALDELKGLRVAALGRHHWEPLVKVNTDPRGRDYLWIGGDHLGYAGSEDSDGLLVERGFATLTPLQHDLTAHAVLDRVRRWDLG